MGSARPSARDQGDAAGDLKIRGCRRFPAACPPDGERHPPVLVRYEVDSERLLQPANNAGDASLNDAFKPDAGGDFSDITTKELRDFCAPFRPFSSAAVSAPSTTLRAPITASAMYLASLL
jgi:hypothetical protein